MLYAGVRKDVLICSSARMRGMGSSQSVQMQRASPTQENQEYEESFWFGGIESIFLGIYCLEAFLQVFGRPRPY